MSHRIKGHSSSPFYDLEFASRSQAKPRIRKKKAKPMPIVTRTIERWTCDRCGVKAEFPDEAGRTALEVGWLKLDLTRSLTQPPPSYVFDRNEQLLCPTDVDKLGLWFGSDSTEAAKTYNDGEDARYHWAIKARDGEQLES